MTFSSLQVVLTEETTATMFGTKLEVVLRKAEAGSWSLIGKEIVQESEENGEKQEEEEEEQAAVDVLDLDDLELSSENF